MDAVANVNDYKGVEKVFSKWIKRNNNYIPATDEKFLLNVSPGLYVIKQDMRNGIFLEKIPHNHDKLLRLPMDEMDKIINEIKSFWQSEQAFKEYGYIFKRAILLHGVPGSGKTSIINLIIEDLVETREGVVFRIFNENDLLNYSEFMPIFRQIQPETPVITIIEDIDGLLTSPWLTTKLLNILDGVEQINKIVYLATTNYPEKLSASITNRPSRFDRRYEIGLPTDKVRKYYIKSVIKPGDLEKIDLQNWVDSTSGMTLSHVADLIKSVLVLKMDFNETIEALKSMKYVPSSEDYKGKMIKKYDYMYSEDQQRELEEIRLLETELMRKNNKLREEINKRNNYYMDYLNAMFNGDV